MDKGDGLGYPCGELGDMGTGVLSRQGNRVLLW